MKNNILIISAGIIGVVVLAVFVSFIRPGPLDGKDVTPGVNTTDPSIVTLDAKEWVWVYALHSDGTKVPSKRPDVFTLLFNKDGSFSAKTDCNSLGGQYSIKDETITFGAMMSTLMYCEGSQEQEFSSMLADVVTYHITSKGELVLSLREEKGSLFFR